MGIYIERIESSMADLIARLIPDLSECDAMELSAISAFREPQPGKPGDIACNGH